MNSNEMFAVRLSELRKAAGLKQAELAIKLNISRSCLANYESSRRHPDIEIVKAIADYFNVSIGYMLGQDDFDVATKRAMRCETELLKVMSKGGRLDISECSPSAKIALIEFYEFLTNR